MEKIISEKYENFVTLEIIKTVHNFFASHAARDLAFPPGSNLCPPQWKKS